MEPFFSGAQMIKLLWILFNYNTSEPWRDSLLDLNAYDVRIHIYNEPPLPSDNGILDAVDRFKPDLIVYTGTAGGPEIPSPATLARCRKAAPTVFLSGDVGDPPWWPYIAEYRKHECFDLYVNFDGNDNWPKGPRDYTCLSPIAPKFFARGDRPLKDRAIEFGFCGTYAHGDANDPRRKILDPLRAAGLVLKPWSRDYHTYHTVGRFLTNVKITVNMPWSGSGQVTQVKARVFEAGLAGCVLIDHVDSQARHWYKPLTDYLEYETPEDVLKLVGSLLREPEIAQKYATNLQRAVHARPASLFWKKLVDNALPSAS